MHHVWHAAAHPEAQAQGNRSEARRLIRRGAAAASPIQHRLNGATGGRPPAPTLPDQPASKEVHQLHG